MSQDFSIDESTRRRLAELVRHFAAGLRTNDAFEDEWLRLSDGKACFLFEMFHWGLWPLFSDLDVHKLTGKYALPRDGKKHVARIILFLRSHSPYKWPPLTGFRFLPVILLSFLTLGWFGRQWEKKRWAEGDQTVWPFFNRQDYEKAVSRPVYLRGHRAASVL